MSELILEIKIKRNSYLITEKDRFMDNGFSIQLLTQSKERYRGFIGIPTPTLPKREVLRINKFKHQPIKSGYRDSIKVFSLIASSDKE